MNGIRVLPYDETQFGFCVIEADSKIIKGQLAVNLTISREDAMTLVIGLGLPVIDPNAG